MTYDNTWINPLGGLGDALMLSGVLNSPSNTSRSGAKT
jgi:hypothetical protein